MPDLSALAGIVPAIVVVLILAAVILPLAIRILREYERGVIFRLGKLLDAKGPGLILFYVCTEAHLPDDGSTH